MKLTDMVDSAAIVPLLRAQTRDGAITELLDALVASDATIKPIRDELLSRVMARERSSSNGVGKGVAIPHAKHPGVSRIHLAIGLNSRGIEFSALDKQPVYSVFMLVSPQNQPDDHIHAMEIIFKQLNKDSFRRHLRQCTTAGEVLNLLEEADARQLS
jgi:mannitol/fructose-specific phosphotransferase system IIA component (Ntr-type)